MSQSVELLCSVNICEMSPRAIRSDVDVHQLRLANVPEKGLGYYDKESRLVIISSVSLKPLGM